MKKILNFIKQKLAWLAAVTSAAVVGGASTAIVMAAIPDGSGVIHGCYRASAGLLDPKGSVRIIDDSSESCTGQETAITWSQTGPQGPQGPQGPAGDVASEFTNLSNQDSLSGLNLNFRSLPSTDFSNSDFGWTSIKGADLHNSNFTGVRMSFGIERTNLSGSNFTDAEFDSGGQFSNSNFSNTDISDRAITNGNFFEANFTDADLTNVAFTNANLQGATGLTPTNLSGSTWDNTTCPDGTNSNDNGNTCIGHLTP